MTAAKRKKKVRADTYASRMAQKKRSQWGGQGGRNGKEWWEEGEGVRERENVKRKEMEGRWWIMA